MRKSKEKRLRRKLIILATVSVARDSTNKVTMTTIFEIVNDLGPKSLKLMIHYAEKELDATKWEHATDSDVIGHLLAKIENRITTLENKS